MAIQGLGLQFGEITAVDLAKSTLSIQSRLDGSVIPDVPIDASLHSQYIPVIGQQVVLVRSDYFTSVISFLGTKKFNAPIKSGEVMFEGSGGGFLYLNQGGDVVLADSAMSNVLKLLSTVGFQFVGDALSLVVKGVGQINIMEDKIEIVKTLGPSDVVTTKVTMTDTKVTVEASTVELGEAPIGNGVFSLSGIVGPYSFDWMGQPIPGSGAVKVGLQ